MASSPRCHFWPGDQSVTASELTRAPILSRIPEDSSPRDHAGASPNRTLQGVHRQSTRRSVTGSTAPRAVETLEIPSPMREERSFDHYLSRIPRASTKLSYTGRSSIRRRDARAALCTGQGEMGRNAAFAVRLREPQANASANASVKERCGQLFYDLHVALGPKLQAQRLERQQTLGRLVPCRQRSCTTTGSLK